MRIVLFLIVFATTVALTILLNIRINTIPPLGQFLDPFNGFWHNAEQVEDMQTVLSFEGLTEPVTVVYDKNLIPRIFAGNKEDLYFAQGYVVASHRLWQMEMITHYAAGRLSEILGPDQLELDRFTRRKGLPHGAEKALETMKQDSALFRLIESFSNGVNAYIASLEYRKLPIEYKLLHYRPEEWTPYKSALLLKYMAEELSQRENDLQNTNALHLFGKDTFDLLFPNHHPTDVPIIPTGTRWNFRPRQIAKRDIGYFNTFINKGYSRPDQGNGSNNWAVNAQKTAAGFPILANDIHLGLYLPGIWFLMQLTTPELNVFGGTIPGALGIITGFNDSIAWGVTNAKQDVVDWYKITFRDKDREEYQYDNDWLKTEKVVEKILVRDNSPFYDTIVNTHHGPVVFDESFRPDHDMGGYAMRWTAHDPSLEQKTFYLLNHAKNYSDFRIALSHYDTPAQNFIFASKKREIAMHVNGRFPLKWHEQGKFLLDGSKSSHEWQDFIPREHLPHAYNPASHFLFSANQIPVDPTYPYYVHDHFYEKFRNKRLQERLTSMSKIRPIDMMALQNDNYNYKAFLSLPFLLSRLDTTTLDEPAMEVFRLLSNWDFYSDPNRKAPSAYETWWGFFTSILWDEFDIQTMELSRPDDYTTINLIKSHPKMVFYNIMITPETETLEDLVKISYDLTLDSLNLWVETKEKDYYWGDYKSTRIMHMLGKSSLSRENINIGGDRGIINANAERHGVSLRMVTELQAKTRSWVIYPGGQSGNPGSRYYDNLIDLWTAGRYIEVHFMRSPEEHQENVLMIQNFQPY
jgi:penicillin G amidase